MDNKLLDILVCPLTKEPLKRDGDWLLNERLGIRYPIRDGIPVMLIEEAKLPDGVERIEDLPGYKSPDPDED